MVGTCNKIQTRFNLQNIVKITFHNICTHISIIFISKFQFDAENINRYKLDVQKAREISLGQLNRARRISVSSNRCVAKIAVIL